MIGRKGERMNALRAFAVVLLACLATPALAQQQGDVIDRIRGFFDRLFTPDTKPQPAPAAEPPKLAPVETRTPATTGGEASPVKPSPVAQANARSLHEYIAKGEYGEALKLMEQGADIEAKDPGAGASVLHYAVMRGRMPMIDLLITRGADVNSRTKMGTTPLHTAVLYARLEVAELLLDAGSDVNAQSASGATPLAIAEAARNQPLVAMLRARGAK
jgi:hypothetical protein